jgi:tight adherence protein B
MVWGADFAAIGSILAGLSAALLAGPMARAWDAWAARRVDDLVPDLRALNLDTARLPALLRLWGLAMIAVGASILAAGMAPLVLPAIGLLLIAPRNVIRFLVERRRSLLRDQLVSATVTLANTARAGQSLAQGLEKVCGDTPEPLASELRQIVQEYNRGRPLDEAIAAAKERLRLEGFTLFSAAVLACLRRGGRITDALVEISRSLQENQRLERKLQAETASGRMVVGLLAAFPFVFLAGFFLLDSEGTGLMFRTLPGQIVLVVVIGLVYASVAVAGRVLKIDI